MVVAVACGAFGAHALRDHLTPGDMQIWEKAVLYHLIHGLTALVVALIPDSVIKPARRRVIALIFLSSLVVFSGTLYLLVLLNQRWLGMITPLGGSGFMLAWTMLGYSLLSNPSERATR